ncbi:MAG: hypothetical protein WEG36_15215 [Gemmatimonadota bacterium]
MRRFTLGVVAVLLFGSLVASCAAGEDGGAGPDDGLVAYTFEEEVRIDGYEHDLVPIDTTIRVAVFEDGRMAIAQRQTFNVRFFSESGEPLGAIGREGQGPGEFTTAHRLGWIADTLYAYDFSQRRFTLIDSDLNYVRYIYTPNGARPSPEMAGTFPEFSIVYGGALYADGSVYGELAGARTPGLGDHDRTKPTYGRVREDGTIISYFQFATGPPMEPIMVEIEMPDGTTGMAGMSPFVMTMPDRPILRLADNGTRMAHLQVSMEGPDAGTYEIFMEDVFDGPLFTRRYPFEVISITEAMRDSIVEARASTAPDDNMGQLLRANAILPPMMPPIVGIVHGSDDRLWIRLSDKGDERPYLILDPMGEPEGRLSLPTNARIAVADDSHIWVIEEDVFEVESLVRYRLLPEDP